MEMGNHISICFNGTVSYTHVGTERYYYYYNDFKSEANHKVLFCTNTSFKAGFPKYPHNLRSMCFSPNSLIFTLCKFQIAVDNHHPYHPFIDDFSLSNCHLGQEASAKLPEGMDCMDCMGHLPVAPQLPILQRDPRSPSTMAATRLQKTKKTEVVNCSWATLPSKKLKND